MGENIDLHDSDADETLSFCDLPLNDNTEWENFSMENRPPSPSQEFFEFSDLSSEIFPLEEIVFCGKLLCNEESFSKNRKVQKVSNSKSSRTLVPTNRIPSDKSFGKCDSSVRKLSAPKTTPSKRHRWHLFMFGLVSFPPEMELRDIKNRQSRRNPATFLPAFNCEETVSVKKSGGIRAKSSWGFLQRALSCRGHANAAVTASLGCIPRM